MSLSRFSAVAPSHFGFCTPAIVGLVGSLLLAVSQGFAAPANEELRHAIDTADLDEATRNAVNSIYRGFDDQVIWASPALQADLFKAAVDLDADGLSEDIIRLPFVSEPGLAVAADINNTVALVRAASFLADGVVATATIPQWSIPGHRTELTSSLISALRDGGPSEFLQSLRPAAPQYARLREAYKSYREIASIVWFPIESSPEVVIGSQDSRLTEVVRRLVVLGDLPHFTTVNGEVLAAVKRFQARHGLAVDGRIGFATLAEFNVSPAARAKQLAINMEYWRLLPHGWPTKYVFVNAAAATLDIVENERTTYATRVIVGDPAHPTPIMATTIRAVTLNPSWTVPRSIAVREILPKLQRSSEYLRRNNIIVVDRDWDPFGVELNWRDYSANKFPFLLRQKPGPRNALGLVKFEMTNDFDVYLHDTPERHLFDRPARALSHGCVRVQCATELAERLLGSPSTWLETNAAGVLATGETKTIPLPNPLPVYVLYFTAFVTQDGQINFRPDIYGRDAAVANRWIHE